MDERPPSADRVPTLTEVIEFGPPPTPLTPRTAAEVAATLENPADLPDALFEPLAVPDLSALEAMPPVPPVPPAADAPAAPDAQALTVEVLGLLTPRIEAMFEARMRETLAPALASAAEGLIRDSRVALTQTLQAMVEEAVARALHRPPEG